MDTIDQGEYWEKRRARDLARIKDPKSWPMWPQLYLKRRGTGGIALLVYNHASSQLYISREAGPPEPITPEQVIAEGWLID